MHKVVILNKSLIQYRKIFYERLKEELNENNIELELIYGKGGNEKKAIKDEIDIKWATYIPNKTITIGNTDLTWQPCLKYLKNKDLVIVDSENKLLINYVLMFQRLFSKRKLAFWGHGRNLQDNPNSLKNRFKYLFIDKCDWWFGYTKGTKQFLKTKKYPEDKITVLQNTIDTQGLRNHYQQIKDNEIKELRTELGISENASTAIYCGAMYPEKNFGLILDVCFRLRKELPDFHMIFIGSGTEANKISKVANENSWIHYVGPKFDNEKVRYFKIAHIQLLPHYVGLGVVDSFAMETPIVTTNNPYHGPEFEYIINKINGLISDDNVEDYYQTVFKTLKDKTYLNLIEGCKNSTNELTIDAMVQNFKKGVVACLKN